MSSLKERNFDGYTLESPRKPFESAFSDVYVYRHPDWDFEVVGGWDQDKSRSFALKFLSKKSDPSALHFSQRHCHYRDTYTRRGL
jgi:hypothetical protein